MKALVWLAVLIGAGVAAVPWLSASFDESGLRDDVVAAPNLSRHGTSLRASTIASYLMQEAKQRGINLQPENLQIEVEAAETGALSGIQVGGQQVAKVQKVTVHVDYRRPLYLVCPSTWSSPSIRVDSAMEGPRCSLGPGRRTRLRLPLIPQLRRKYPPRSNAHVVRGSRRPRQPLPMRSDIRTGGPLPFTPRLLFPGTPHVHIRPEPHSWRS